MFILLFRSKKKWLFLSYTPPPPLYASALPCHWPPARMAIMAPILTIFSDIAVGPPARMAIAAPLNVASPPLGREMQTWPGPFAGGGAGYPKREVISISFNDGLAAGFQSSGPIDEAHIHLPSTFHSSQVLKRLIYITPL